MFFAFFTHLIRKYPKTLCGVKKGKKMTIEEADNGRVNYKQPKAEYKNAKNEGYWRNCQSCVVAFEARMRGYDVSAVKYSDDNPIVKIVADDVCWPWLTCFANKPNRNNYVDASECHTPKELYDFLDKVIEPKKRYILWFYWVKRGHKAPQYGHVVNILKEKIENKKGKEKYELTLIDNQKGIQNLEKHKRRDDDLRNYFGGFDLTTPGYAPKVLRIDNKGFNIQYTEPLLENKEEKE